MKLLRTVLLALVLCCGALGDGALQATVATAAPTLAAPQTTVATEDAPTQTRAFADAYNLLLDHYVQPLDTSQLLQAAWDALGKEAAVGKVATPGPAPSFTGNRTGDLQAISDALTNYLAQPNSSPDGFIAAHTLIRGMVHFVEEGHTYFMDPQQYKDYQSLSRGDNTYVGIGISVSAKGPQPRIVEVYDGTPAQAAGLHAGDILVRVNDHPADGLPIDQLTGLMRGPAGTSVELVVRRGDDPQEQTYSVTRAEIHLQIVTDRVVQDDIGYIQLRAFPEPSVVDAIQQDIGDFENQGVQGLVLDLRGNSGGRIDVGTRLLGDFLPNGTAIYQELDRGGATSTHSTRGTSQYDLPLVVLVDGGTASMSEIFASALQEHGAATIVGTNTAGSVAAAQVFGLPDGSALQVTVFQIEAADGKPLNNVGVVPDAVVGTGDADVASGTDPVLDRAVEVLHAQLAGSGSVSATASD
jgi:carboxyl-terminal processing protease